MMKKFKKIVLTLLLMFIVTINVDALTVKESSKDYTGDVYVFGSTKFDENTIVTLSAAGLAGMNEAKLQLAINGEIDTSKVKTYYYSELTQNWSEVTVETGKLRLLSDAESANLEENLNIYYVNNKEKTFEIPFNGTVDEGSLKPNSIDATSKAEVKDGKLVIPASWIGGFTFTSNNTLVSVDLSKTVKEDVKELDKPLIKINPAISLTTNDEVYVGENLTVKLAITANDYKGSKATAKLIALDGGNSLTANYNKDVVISDSVESAKLTFSASGVFTIKYTLTFENGNTSEVTRTINVLDADVVLKSDKGYYKSIAEAVNAGSSEITVLKDFNIDKPNTVYVNNNIVVDFNGKTVTANANSGKEAEPAILIAGGNGSHIIFKNGSLVRTENSSYGVIQIGELAGKGKEDTKIDLNGMNIIFEKNFTLKANWYGLVILGTNSFTDVYGTILTDGAYAISGNYSSGYLQNSTVNIHEGAKLVSTSDTAIYMPSYMKVNILGGEITGKTAIGIKLGDLTIKGGTLTATGTKVENSKLKPTGNGFNPTGDAIYVEVNDTYYKHYQTHNKTEDQVLNITIIDGKITSNNGNVIRVYNPTKSEPNFRFDLTKSIEDNNVITFNNVEAEI